MRIKNRSLLDCLLPSPVSNSARTLYTTLSKNFSYSYQTNISIEKFICFISNKYENMNQQNVIFDYSLMSTIVGELVETDHKIRK